MTMKTSFYLLVLFGCFWACSRSTDDATIPPLDDTKNVTASLNDSVWYGHGVASRVSPLVNGDCGKNRFNLSISNALPYPKGLRQAAPSICAGPCDRTQYLSFEKVPLAVGKYDIASLNTCASTPLTGVNYGLIVGGDAVFSSYIAKEPASGWIEITKADTVANVLEGKFEVTLVSRSDNSTATARFRNGLFSLGLTK
ncbi:MAG: hypothetical protein BGO59_03785 [Spirosoma sp. 48-14]|nr:MAG: hypothetical protein BGO59_03785 [Spirosoma sp. 48-14]